MIYIFLLACVVVMVSFFFGDDDPFGHYNYVIHGRILGWCLSVMFASSVYEMVSQPKLESSTYIELRGDKITNSLDEDYHYRVTELKYVGSLPFSYSPSHKEYVYDLYKNDEPDRLIASDTIDNLGKLR